MKVCLYLEFDSRIKVSGVKTAFRMHQKALKAAGVTFTTNPNEEFDIFHPYFPGPRSFFIARQARRAGKKVVTHAHVTAEDFRHTYFFSTVAYPLVRFWLTRFYRLGTVVIAPSAYTARLLRGYGIANPIKVVSNGVDLAVFKEDTKGREAVRARYHLLQSVVFSVGWVFVRKGVETFSKTAHAFPDHSFVWFGQFTRQKLIPPMLHEQRAQNLLFTGYVPDIVAAMNAGDVFFFPSYEENQGIVILEAGALGKPIVVRDIPAYDGWLVDGVNCLKGKTDEELRVNLGRVLADAALRARLSHEARRLAESHSLEKIGEELKEVYNSILISNF